MDIIQHMRTFVRVVEAGSFVKAAQKLNLSAPYVSRMVAELEEHLKSRLLNRTTRRIALTENGERFFARAQQILGLLAEAQAEAADALANPSGRLRIHSITSFGQRHLIPLIARYQKLYPDVKIDLTLSQRQPDLLEEGYDVTLSVSSQIPDSGMMIHHLGASRSVLCASPEYLAAHGQPLTPEDVRKHDCVQIVSLMYPKEWVFGKDGQEKRIAVKSVLTVNVPEAAAAAVRDGMGIGLLPAYAASEYISSGKLVRLLPDYLLPEHRIYALYPSRQFLDAKIKTWLDFLKTELPPAIARSEAVLTGGAVSPR